MYLKDQDVTHLWLGEIAGATSLRLSAITDSFYFLIRIYRTVFRDARIVSLSFGNSPLSGMGWALSG
jgi:hypothetical protein